MGALAKNQRALDEESENVKGSETAADYGPIELLDHIPGLGVLLFPVF